MWTPLKEALKEHFPENQSKIGLKALSQASGLSISMWAERLKSVAIGYYIREALEPHGFSYTSQKRGYFNTFTFYRIIPETKTN